MTHDPFTGAPTALTYRREPPRPMTETQILMALVVLVLITFGFVAWDALKDRGTICHIRVETGPRGWRTLYCPPGAQFDGVAIDEPWQPKGYP